MNNDTNAAATGNTGGPRRRGGRSYVLPAGASLALLVAVLAGCLVFYASTARFANFVQQKVVSVLEDATGGRVELKSFHWNAWNLSAEVEDLTIHGLEGPGEQPYAHVDRIYLRARILSFVRAKLGLEFLEADRPTIHLIVYPDGSTNQPKPKAAEESSNDSPVRTVFDLEANRVEIHDGRALINQRSIPFSLAANDMGVVITWAPLTRSYLGNFTCADITAQKGNAAVVRSKLDLTFEAVNDKFDLKSLALSSGDSRLQAAGTISHFAHPQWRLSADGTVELAELTALGVVDGLKQGAADISIQAQGNGSDFAMDGKAKVNNATYSIPYVLVDGAKGSATLHITPREITLSDIVGYPRQGGMVNATLRYSNWMAPATPAAPIRQGTAAGGKPGSKATPSPLLTPTMSIRARVRGVLLSTVMYTVVERPYRDLGFDTLGEGPVDIDWTGDASDLTVAANLVMRPPASPARGEVPLSGTVDAKYFQQEGLVRIRSLAAQSQATLLAVSGELGVYPIDRLSNLEIHLVNHNLGEFDRVLKVLDLGLNGKKGISGVPIQLHGDAIFDGQGTGSLLDPAFKGHLVANEFSTTLTLPAPPAMGKGPRLAVALPAASGAGSNATRAIAPSRTVSTTISWDHLDLTGSYSSSLISVEQAVLRRGNTMIHASGQLEAHHIGKRRVEFDDQATINADAHIQNANLTDLLAIAGQDLPVTGNVNFQAHATGVLGNLEGGANLTVDGGAIAGLPYHSAAATLAFSGQEVRLTRLTLQQDGGVIIGNGSYNLGTGEFLGNLDGANFELAHLPQPQDPRLALAGAMKFDVHASGTFDTFTLLGGLHLRNLVLGGQPAGALEAVAHTQGGTVFFTAQNSLISAGLQVKGQTELNGDFPTQATIVLAKLNIAPFLRLFHVQTVTGNSSIGGTIEGAGPLKNQRPFSGAADINQVSATLQGIPLQAEGPLRLSLHQGVLHITQAHITGPDTDLSLAGTAALTGNQALQMTGNGSMNMKLVQTFDPDITSSGHVDFNVDADGTVARPLFSGRIHLANVALALNDLPNGISNLTGNLVFDENRLEVQELVGTTGGGQLKFGGYLTYQQGIYGDFTATGKDIRVRYRGISATADTSLHLQGSQTNMLLAGSVQVTRFIIGRNVDFASFAPGPAASIPPDPNAPSSRVRLDVHIFSAPQLDFQNSYAQLAGSLDLHIRGTVAQPAILGRINITDGTANFAGTTYQLQHGDIYFTNPVTIQPLIDIDATTRVEEYDVTIGLHGNVNQLTPTFRSEPPLPQADVISLLALGRTQEEQALYSQQEQSIGVDSTTNALLGGALNAAVGSRVQKLFGGGSVKIDPTYVGTVGSSSARITVQQNISRNVQVTYATNVNATAQQLIQAQVDITSSVSLLAVRDEAGVFSMVLKVRKRYR